MIILNFNVNWLGVILVVIVSMVLGFLWYSKYLFGKQWMALVGMPQEMTPEMKKNMGSIYMRMTLSSFVQAYALAFFIKNMFISNVIWAVVIGFIAWLGFIATTSASEYLFNAKQKPWALYRINVSYQLVYMLIASVILFHFTIH